MDFFPIWDFSRIFLKDEQRSCDVQDDERASAPFCVLMSLKRSVQAAKGRVALNTILPIHDIGNSFFNLTVPQLRCFIGAIKDSTKTIQY